MANDLDPRYLSEHTKDLIAGARKDLQENPITKQEQILSWFRVTVYYPAKIWWLKLLIKEKKK